MTSLDMPAILVVDDNEAGRYVKTRTLRQAGYVVLEAGDGSSALELVVGEDLSLVLLDVHLPDMLGFEVCRRLKSLRPSVPVLMTSATYIESEDRSFGLDEGADAYLTEPMEQTVLLSQVRALHRMRAAEQRQRESEWRQAFLLQLSDVLRPLADPVEVEEAACRLLAERLKVDRAYFVEIDRAAGIARVQRDFVRGGAPSLAGEHRIADFAWSVAILERGERHVIADTRTSDLVPERDRPAFTALGITACMGAPLIKRGSLLGALCVADENRRDWRDSEADLLQEVGERIWSAVERARAEVALLERNRQLEVIAKVSEHLLRQSPSRISAIADAAMIVAGELGFEHYFYFTADEKTRVLKLEGALGLDTEQRAHFSNIRFGQFLCGLVAERRERLIVTNLHLACYPEAELLRAAGVTFYAGFPLIADGVLVGTLAFATRSRSKPREGDILLLQAFCDQAAVQLARNLGEQRLRESEERLTFAYDIAGIAAWDVDLVQNVSFWSPRLFDMLGIDHGQRATPDLLFDRVLPEDLPLLRQAYVNSIAARTTFRHEFRIRRPNGEVRHLGGIGCVVAESEGRPTRMIGVNFDNTDRKLAQADKARLAAIVESSGEAIISKTLNGIVTSWNAAAERMFGYTASEMIGGNILRIVPSDRWGEEDEALVRIRRGERVKIDETIRIRKDGRPVDVSETISPILDDRGLIIGASKIARDITAKKRHEERERVLMGEINHRAKNMLGLVQSIARQTVAGDPRDFVERFVNRIQALSASQNVLVNSGWQNVPVDALVRSQLGHFDGLIGSRIIVSGPPFEITAAAAQALGLALHELATNAAKYGALSNDEGVVDVSWRISNNGSGPLFSMTWIESGGPPVLQPERCGFGSTVTTTLVKMTLDGEVETDFAPAGLTWRLTTSATKLMERTGSATEMRADDAVHGEPSGQTRVLVVEDEPLIAVEIATALEEAGFAVVGPVGSVDRAFRLISECHGAVLDVNLGEETAEPIAVRLAQSGVPFVVVTGYSSDQIPAAFNTAPLVAKPIRADRLIAVLRQSLPLARPGAGNEACGH